VKVAIASGELAPGEGLPSVRQLASRLRINPATVVQAYRGLEEEGFVEVRQGAGTFVKEVADQRRDVERSRQASLLIRRMLAEAGRLRLATPELRAAFDREIRPETA